MKNTLHYFSIAFLVCLVLFTCCKEECDDPTDSHCPNYDPCWSVSAADASFVVLDSIIPTWADTTIGFVCDTFNTGSTVYFRALNKYMFSYEWRVGTDPTVFMGQEFHLGFYGYDGSVTVRLVTTAEDNHGCLSEAEIRDTSYQTFDVIPTGPFESPIFGNYLGSDTANPDQEYTLTVLGEGVDLWHSYRLFDLPVPCDYPIGLRLHIGHDWLVSVHDDIHCRNTIVVGRLQEDNNTLHVNYYYDDDDGKRRHYFFEGVRQ